MKKNTGGASQEYACVSGSECCIFLLFDTCCVYACERRTRVEALEALLVDQAAAFLSPGDVGRPALGGGELLPSTGRVQLPPGHEVPGHTVLCVLALYAAVRKRDKPHMIMGHVIMTSP